ncbi:MULTISPECIES: PilZ domain-containing protein [unclassified Pseudomonas]|uniref:PilZ domain-containing protein n=1 Tax=unclassified Pseudomonas TaxID=196821 RepID=UPI000BA2C7E2|nr:MULTISPECIES: PilZ domain-containing protein [unclassified Pseudomonas]MDN4544655.1 PilZ domain-containing protein [Pseudomonas sp. C32]
MSIATSLSANVVHEATDERQFVRIKIPATVILQSWEGPLECEIQDISLGGISLLCGKELKIGSMYSASIRLNLSTININIDARIRVVSQRADEVGAEFIELDAQKRDILRYMIAAYMSGEVADFNGLFNVMQRENYIKERKKVTSSSRTVFERLQAMLGSLLFLALGLLVMSLLAYKTYLFFFRVSAAHAQVSAEAYQVNMPENGYVKFMVGGDAGEVKAGEPIATVSTQLLTNFNSPADLQALASLSQSDLQTLLGRSLIETVIASPCDCYVYFPGRKLDSYAYKTDPLLHLIPKDQPLVVKASFPFDKLKDINRIQRVSLRVSGMPGAFGGKVVGSAVDSVNQMLVLSILPETTLPLSAYQHPVAVDVYLDLPFDPGF